MKYIIMCLCAAMAIGCSTPPTVERSIDIVNTSFEEGEMDADSILGGWESINEESDPDWFISNSETNPWEVRATAHSGDRYIGMVVNALGKQEGLQQQLAAPISDVRELDVSMWVSLSERYYHANALVEILRNYAKPAKISIIVTDSDGEEHVIHTSAEIDHSEWRQLRVTAPFCGDMVGVAIAVIHSGEDFYNGHVMVDDVAFSCRVEE